MHACRAARGAQMGELRTAWSRAARVDADASTSSGTAIRTARRAAEATAAEEEATAAEEEAVLLLHAWVEFCVFLGVDLI